MTFPMVFSFILPYFPIFSLFPAFSTFSLFFFYFPIFSLFFTRFQPCFLLLFLFFQYTLLPTYLFLPASLPGWEDGGIPGYCGRLWFFPHPCWLICDPDCPSPLASPGKRKRKKIYLPLTLFHDSFFVFHQIPYNILRIFQNRTA